MSLASYPDVFVFRVVPVALLAVAKDPEFLNDAHKAGLDIDPASAAEATALLNEIAAYPSTLLAKAKAAMER